MRRRKLDTTLPRTPRDGCQRYLKWVYGYLFLTFSLALLPTSATAADAPTPLETRAGVHDGFARLVFASPGGTGEVVAATAAVDGTTLTIRFDKPVALPLDKVRLLAGYLDAPSLSADGKTLTAQLKKPVQLKQERLNAGAEMIDLVDQPQPKETRTAAAAPTPAAAPVAAAPRVAPPTPPPSPIPAAPSPTVAVPPPAAVATSKVAAVDTRPATGTVGHGAGKALQIHYTVIDDGVSIRFDWADPVGAAVFSRGNAVWIAFDQAQKLDFSDFQPLKMASVKSLAQVQSRTGTVLRLGVMGGTYPWARRAGNAWVIDLRSQPQHVDSPIEPAVKRDPAGAAIDFPVMQPGVPISVTDPDAGDTIVAVPAPQLGQGIEHARGYADFDLLPSTQGLAVHPIADQLSVVQQPDAVEITVPGGLTLSPEEDRNLPPPLASVSGTLLSPSDWAGKLKTPYPRRLQTQLAALISAPEEERTSARVDLARFYFANGLAAETLGVLRTAEHDVPNLADDPSIRLMQGAAEEMMRQLDTAATDLGDHGIDGRVDTSLWRAMLAVDQHDWKTASALAMQGKGAIKDYPPDMRRRLSLPIADALFTGGSKQEAGALAADVLSENPTQGERDYAMVLLGRLAADRNDIGKALDLWGKAAKSPAIDLGRAQAAFALAVTKYDKGQMSRPDAIAAIDRLRYAWRGDDFELLVLRKLAELYAADSDYRMAFDTLRRIPAAFPDSDAARDATGEMQKIFTDLFLTPSGDALPPLTSLALYEEFKELTPAGAQGDAIIRKLADRLVSVDLLDRAGNLLDDQVKNRLTGVDQARVAAQLALVRLLDHRPDDAIAALDVPAKGDLPPDLVRQRAELRARAQVELGKTDDALATLRDDTSADADRLRGDIYDKSQAWPQLAALLQKGVKDPGPDGKLDADGQSTVMRIATAMVLAKDRAGLAALRKKYGAAMDDGAYKDTFRVVAGDTEADSATFKTLADRVAQISDLQSFMSEYRQRIQQDKLSAIN